MTIAACMLVIVGGLVAFAGFRVRALVPAHWTRVTGQWIGPSLRWSPSPYAYVTTEGVGHSGVARVRVMFRPPTGGTCVVAYDPADPSRSHPAQLRWNGGVLIAVGVVCAIAGSAFAVLALA
ncbi:hypothetical protein MUN77_15475 [Leucobacter allii]|uniref:DUF3592 domain-containing protein n=1 Tax=Leucobacter allii TaxID=2932247 RepID=UPI001FD241A5|nr:DUF3592 domain-containing protein [Leucobacter allii]UOR01508.1 hypothetical protein MUN77_15475 [Leucobacter allii]